MSVSTLLQIKSIPIPLAVVKNDSKITVITRDNVRVLHPHGEKQRTSALVLKSGDLDRIKAEAKFISQEQEHEIQMRRSHERVAQAEAAQHRRARMEELEKQAAHLEISDVEREAKDKANYLLSKAQSQRDEQEDDIKRVNELILNAKCVAIRDAQVEEKKIIRKVTKEEEQRLDAVMESIRQAELKQAEEKRLTRMADMQRGAQIIQQQIAERREAHLLEAERRDQETKATLAVIAKQADADKAQVLLKLQAQRNLMHQVAAANVDAINKKKEKKLRDQEEDRQLLKYLQDKEKREVEKDREAKERKAEREKDLGRLRAAQKKVTDKLAEQDSLRAKRAYEAHEREWRRKELESLDKKARCESSLREERSRQQAARESAISMEALHLRTEFMNTLRELEAKEAKIKQDEHMKHLQNRKYSLELKKQILERESEKKKARAEFFNEGVILESNRRDKRVKIDGIRRRKLDELRSLNVPEKYCKEVERKLVLTDRPGRLAL